MTKFFAIVKELFSLKTISLKFSVFTPLFIEKKIEKKRKQEFSKLDKSEEIVFSGWRILRFHIFFCSIRELKSF